MVNDSWLDPQAEEKLRELVGKNIAAHKLLGEPLQFVKVRGGEVRSYPVSRVYVIGGVHDSEDVWMMSFNIRNLLVEPEMGKQGSNVPVMSLQSAEAAIPVPRHFWKQWTRKRNGKVEFYGNLTVRPRQASA